jgi:TonB family protein
VNPGASALPRTVGLLAISAAAHIVAFAASPSRFPRLERPPVTATDSWEMLASTRPPEPGPPEPPAVPAATPPAAAPPREPRPRPARPPLQRQTLTSDRSDANWSSDAADLATLRDAAPEPPSPAPVQPSPPAVAGPTVVPLASLSRRPAAPGGLDALLRRFYPRRARSQGIEGSVTVRMRVLPDGRVSEIRVLDERPAGFDFAGACLQLLRAAPAFVPPLDRTGKRVATDIPFRCTFEIDY